MTHPTDNPPDATILREAALAYLAKYSSTEASLRRVLLGRIDRWARRQAAVDDATLAAARAAANAVVADLARLGAVDDAAYARARARSLERSGRSRLAIQAKLAAKGVSPGISAAVASSDPETELAAALVSARRRRIGPFRQEPAADPAVRQHDLGRLARAGFSRATAERALDMGIEEAEQLINALRA